MDSVYHALLQHDSYVLARRHSFSLPVEVCSHQTQMNDLSQAQKPANVGKEREWSMSVEVPGGHFGPIHERWCLSSEGERYDQNSI